ncbi:hypothetical protein KVP40.0307 [Vibrio phage KVP40]|uniref:Uncharacterized protein n=2 Tax=Schizotequatrovirus KVP40 TaxID=1914019 RepID=Q6WHJ6_BPKVM|nr:hypothetical protein KVP40.0307 [Vibrio phage KVP40]QIW90117.1 hypothetical protein OLCHANIL_00020 [Vibrio phage V05]QIW91105.1 hypothetical protein COHAPHLL_00269 [Vibrio phage V09]UNA01822.1 hypothetical protein [Vibrio phage PC-Liy1]URQ03118.1 hypothetical protein PVA8_132 [Vibrio phage PVA8]WBM58854.1 hypothetical protein vBValMPVA8_132 [Vibrio phage vB_ValM_PVA8]WOL25062.1 hypothetical protein [Vibrio phage PG216]
MKNIHQKSHAREGRGLGNGFNDNWRNASLWKNIGPDAEKIKKEAEEPEEEIKEVKQENLEDLSERERMRRLMRLAH